jgi:hypothetical protein
MGNRVEHVDAVLSDTLADPRVTDPQAKCAGLKGLVKIGFVSAERFEKLAECASAAAAR